mmetsp:Transcript_79255/g.169817  ORF Transcript_79255/g.169817 Transcript_79255/m.169817 type:complete len:225 (-) Transcript_79255:1335-2009(-)
MELSSQGRQGETVEDRDKGEEAEEDHDEDRPHSHSEELPPENAIVRLQVVPRHVQRQVNEKPEGAARQAVDEALDGSLPIAQPRFPDRLFWLEDDVVSPAEVQELQPEAHNDVVVHGKADGIEAACARDRSALGQAPVLGLWHIASLLATAMQGAEGQLADGVGVTRRLEVARGPCEQDEGAIRHLRHVRNLRVLAIMEVGQLQAALVVGVQGGSYLLVEGYQD